MNLYLDTEFTGLHSKAELISIGIVSDDNSCFYAEFTDYRNPTTWVINNVVPYLTNSCYMLFDGDIIKFERDRKEIVHNLNIWLSQWDHCKIIGDTLSIDWLLFLDLFNWQLPKNIYYLPIDITTLFYVADIDMDITRLDYVNIETTKHNALNDAVVIKLCYEKLMRKIHDSI